MVIKLDLCQMIYDIHDKYRSLISTVKLHPDSLIYDNQNNKYIQFTNIILPNLINI